MSPGERIEQLLTLAGELTRLVQRENRHLTARRPAALALEREAKEHLTAAFERGMSGLKAEKQAMAAAAPGHLARLRQATAGLQEALVEHRRLVQAAKTVGERMLRAIAQELDLRQRPATIYDQAANPRRAAIVQRSRPLSLALNQVI